MNCPHCPNTFRNIYNLRRHVKNIHKMAPDITFARNNNNKCAQDNCHFASHTLKQLIEHLERVHQIRCETETLKFADEQEFESWKQKMEFDTNSVYVKGSGRHEVGGKIFKYFRCHRSGFYRPEARSTTPRKRKLKIIGSTKIGAVCTSHICYCKNERGVTVTFYKTHYKHSTTEVEYLPLSDVEKLVVLEKLWDGLSLDMVREDLTGNDSSLVRPGIHLRRQDRENIIHQYGLAKNDPKQDDSSTLESWVTEMTELGKDSPVRVFKPKGVRCPELDLESDDFCLVVMTASQRELLAKFGTNGVIFVDSSVGLNTDQLEITTVLTIDNQGEVFPVGFLISNRHTVAMMAVFYDAIKDNTGPISAQVFMSDDTEVYYSPWSQVMGEVPVKFLSTWQVEIAWRKNLVKIKDKVTRKEILNSLSDLRNVSEIADFRTSLFEMVQQLNSNPKTTDFGQYFEECYSSRPELWASCFRKNMHHDSSANFQTMHKTLLRMYLNGKKNRNLSQTICAMIKLVRDKYSEWESNASKGKMSARMVDIEESHKLSLKIKTKIQVLSKNKWLVKPDEEDTRSYIIEARSASPCCQFQCSKCKVCPHMYACNCPDSVVKFNVCKHIHYLTLGLQQLAAKELDNELENECDNESESDPIEPSEELPEISSSPKTTSNGFKTKTRLRRLLPKTKKLEQEKFLKHKVMLKKHLTKCIAMVDASTTMTQLQEAKKALLALPEVKLSNREAALNKTMPKCVALVKTSKTINIPVIVTFTKRPTQSSEEPFVLTDTAQSLKTYARIPLKTVTTVPKST